MDLDRPLRLVVSSLSVSLALAACNPDIAEPTEGCTGLAECPLDQVCDVPSGQCIEEPPNRILGKFSCEVAAAKPPEGSAITFLRSELLGHVGDKRAVLSTVAFCWESAAVDNQLSMLWFDFTNTFALTLGLDLSQAARGGRLQVGIHGLENAPNSGELFTIATEQRVGTTAGGFVDLQPAVVGRTIEGYVDLQMFEAIDEHGVAGVPCPRGHADCGKDRIGQFQTLCLDNPPSSPICTATCDLDVECAGRGDAICVGLCFKQCTTNSDCDQPLRCTMIENEPRRVCH